MKWRWDISTLALVISTCVHCYILCFSYMEISQAPFGICSRLPWDSAMSYLEELLLAMQDFENIPQEDTPVAPPFAEDEE